MKKLYLLSCNNWESSNAIRITYNNSCEFTGPKNYVDSMEAPCHGAILVDDVLIDFGNAIELADNEHKE